MKKILLVCSILVLASVAFAQQKAASSIGPYSTNVCAYTQTSGSGLTFFQTCETVNGNVVQFTSPSGFEHIRIGNYYEGYGICDYYAGTGYWDTAYQDSGNWQAPITVTTVPLKILRTTTDGVFTLTQTFARTNPENILKITMNLRNNYGSNYSGGRWIWFTRFADIDANNSTVNNFTSTRDAVLGWNEGYSPNQKYGLGLYTAPANTTVGHFAGVMPLNSWWTNENPCNYPSSQATTLNMDGLAYSFHYFALKPGTSKTVAVEYKRF
jgi:hypothetical protein